MALTKVTPDLLTLAVGDGGLTQKNFTLALKTKLDGIATGANNYTLPFTNNSSDWDTAHGWGDHSAESYATQTYVGTQITNLVDSAPATLDTLNELASALGDNPNFATTVTNSIAAKLPLTGGSLTGSLSVDATVTAGGLAVAGTDNTDVASLGTTGQRVYIKPNGTEIIYNAKGTSAGQHVFQTDSTESLRVNAAGIVTKPQQPSVAVHPNNNQSLTQDGSWRKLTFDTVSYQTGSHYSTSASRFTAPVAGKYLFGMDLQIETASSISWMYIVPYVNGSASLSNLGITHADFTPDTYYVRRSGTFLLNLGANDYVELFHSGSGGSATLKGNPESTMFFTLLS